MNKKAKGFTLIELIIVIAIIGVLSAILIPSWMNYIRSSRIKTQNNNAKVVFNAAQTVTQRYKFRERGVDSSNRDIGDGDFYFLWNGTTGFVCDSSGNDAGADSNFNSDYADAINNFFSGSEGTVYKIYVNDYIVKSVVSGRTDADSYLGSFPERQDDASEGDTVSGYDMSTIVYTP